MSFHRVLLFVRRLLLLAVLRQFASASGADVFSPPSPAVISPYAWSTTAVSGTAQLVTLSCHLCETVGDKRFDVPLLSVLRDTLGDASPENDQLSYIWLLTTGRLTFSQRLLSAVPFFYWRVGARSATESSYPKPLLSLNTPLYGMMDQAARSVVQWAAFDPLTTWVRASSRSFGANQADSLRLQLEQAIGYLRDAPAPRRDHAYNEHSATPEGLSEGEVNILIGRLEGRKSMLGGLLQHQYVAKIGQQTTFKYESIRSRNAEVIRLMAEKTGTYIEPLNLTGSHGEFAILWFCPDAAQPSRSTSTKPIWRVLNIKDPWSDPSLAAWRGPSFQRAFDRDDRLLPQGEKGVRTSALVPLAIYSLSYPQMPLLLIDFRDRWRVRRYEMAQRAVTELTAGVLGLSQFTNWYYYAGVLLYQTVWARRGTAANQDHRLDCYANFRMRLAFDHELDPRLRKEALGRVDSLIVNPLDSDPVRDMSNAHLQYAWLVRAAAEGELAARLDRDRRAELAAFGVSIKANVIQNALHLLSLGTYTRCVRRDQCNRAILDRNRRIQYQLDFLDSVIENGSDPRVAFSSAQIDDSVRELRWLSKDVKAEPVRRHMLATIGKLQSLSGDKEQMVNASQVAGVSKAAR